MSGIKIKEWLIPEHEFTFQFVRSSGPGGQNVNKVNSKAQLRWNLAESKLPESIKERFQIIHPNRIREDGVVFLQSERFRDQEKNKLDCLEKLTALLLEAATPPKTRKKTKLSKATKTKRRENKKKQSQKKQSRRWQHD